MAHGFDLGHCFGGWFWAHGTWFAQGLSVTLHLPQHLEASWRLVPTVGGPLEATSSTSTPTFGDLGPYYADVDRASSLRGLSWGYLMYCRWAMYLILLFYWKLSFPLLVLGVLVDFIIILF